MLGWLPLVLLAGSVHETAVERHHRKGVHCMDVIERADCAIEQFEAVLEEDTRERELVTDAMVRLVRLYRKAGDADALASVLRRYWDVGTARQSRGHIPYGMRFVSAELDVMFVGDIAQARDSVFLQRTSPHTTEFIFTCDEQARADILMTERWKRAEQIAARRGVTTQQVYYEAWDERRARRARQEQRRDARRRDEDTESKAPIFSDLPCELAKRLGHDGLQHWDRLSGAASHQDYRRSMMIADIPDVRPRIDAAVREGTLELVGTDHWVLTDYAYAGQAVHMLRVDKDQLLFARADMIDPVLEAAKKRKRRMNRELERLAQQVPRDSAMLFAMTQAAVVGSGFGNMREGAATVLQALLPKPKGLQVSLALSDVAGVFTRVPTNNPVKGRMLVNLATSLLEGQAQDDPEMARMLENLDIAEAGDRRALLAAYLLDVEQLADMMWG